VITVHTTAPISASAPTWNEYFTVSGMPLGVAPSTPKYRNTIGSVPANVAPSPMKKLCMTNPVVRCSSLSLSATNARNGSMLMLMHASSTHSSPAAIQSVDDVGMMKSARLARMAPTRKYGRRRPSLPHVRSLSDPTIGCTMSPVRGAASQRIGMRSGWAPSFS
jgi:hypothetical protein